MVPPLKNEEGGRGNIIIVKQLKHFQEKFRLFFDFEENTYRATGNFHCKYHGFSFAPI